MQMNGLGLALKIEFKNLNLPWPDKCSSGAKMNTLWTPRTRPNINRQSVRQMPRADAALIYKKTPEKSENNEFEAFSASPRTNPEN